MNRARFGLLGLCAMVFGLLAFSATAAQAEVGAKWLFAEKEPNSGLIAFLEATIGLETEVSGVLHTEISKTKVLFLCTTIQAENAVLKANGGIGTGAKIKFSGCTTDLNGATSKPCEPSNEGKEPGVIKTKLGHGLLILHKLASGTVDDLVSITPDVGETFATIEMGLECSIGQKVPVIGKATLKDCQGLGRSHLVKHLVEVGSKAELTELWTISKTVEHEATILGSAWAFLTGAHEKIKFGGDPV